MKALQIVTGLTAAGLAAAFLAGAVWAQRTGIDWDHYFLSADAVSIAGAALGALFVALAARLTSLAATRRERGI